MAEPSSGSNSDKGSLPREGTGRASIFAHLEELATRLKRSLFAYIIALAAISSIPDPIHPFGGQFSFYGYNFLLMSLIRRAESSYAPGYVFFPTSPTDPIFAFLNVSMVVALLISLPYVFYEIYGFVAPGLYQREKRVVRKYVLPFSVLLTLGGIFGLFVVFPTVMRILLLFYKPLGVSPLISIDSFVNLLMLIPVMTGLAFTFPVYIVPLVELRILNAKQLSSARKWMYVLTALAVGLVNPDPTFISSIPIIVPIFVLYEVTVFMAKRIEKNRAAKTVT